MITYVLPIPVPLFLHEMIQQKGTALVVPGFRTGLAVKHWGPYLFKKADEIISTALSATNTRPTKDDEILSLRTG